MQGRVIVHRIRPTKSYIPALVALFWALCGFSSAQAQQSLSVEQTSGSVHALHTSPIMPSAPLPQVNLYSDKTVGSLGLFSQRNRLHSTLALGVVNPNAFLATGNVTILAGSEFVMHSDSLLDDEYSGIATASGHVIITEIDLGIMADKFTLNEATGTLQMRNPVVHFAPFYLSGDELTLLNDKMTVTNANIGAAPPSKKQDIHVTAKSATANITTHVASLRNLSVYIKGTRLITFNKARLTFGQAGKGGIKQGLHPVVGNDSLRGFFVRVSQNVTNNQFPLTLGLVLPEKSGIEGSASISRGFPFHLGKDVVLDRIDHDARLTPGTGLAHNVALMRDFASEPGAPLPLSDPLLFHDFLETNPLETIFNRPVVPEVTPSVFVSNRSLVSGRNIGNLSYSSVPDASLRFDIPLLGNPDLPLERNSNDMHRALGRLYMFAAVTGDSGYFHEEPSNVKSSKDSLNISFDTRPLLIGHNTLFRPRITFYTADYPSVRDRYSSQQIDVAIEHVFSTTNGVGLEFIGTAQGGKDPFKFDTVDTSQEVDIRAQSKFFSGALSGRVKYDLLQRRIFNWEVGYSITGGALVPTITYQSPGGAIGLSINVPGLTFW